MFYYHPEMLEYSTVLFTPRLQRNQAVPGYYTVLYIPRLQRNQAVLGYYTVLFIPRLQRNQAVLVNEMNENIPPHNTGKCSEIRIVIMNK